MTEVLQLAMAWILGTLVTLVVMLYRRMGRAERHAARVGGQLDDLRREVERDRLIRLVPEEGGGEPETDEPDGGRRRLRLVPPISLGIGAVIATRLRHTFEAHTATATTVTATVAGLAGATLLWGMGTVFDSGSGEDRPVAAPTVPHTPNEETIPPSPLPTPSPRPTDPPTPGSPAPTPSPTGPADTGPVGEASPTEPSTANEPTPASDTGSTVPGADGGGGEPTDGAGGGDGGTGGDEPTPGEDIGGTNGGVDGGADAGGTATGGGEPPAEPDRADGLVCVGLSLPPLLDIDRLCLL